MDTESITEIIKDICFTAINAGNKIIEIKNSSFSIEYKKDNSPLTLADLASNEIITRDLLKYHFPLLSEEGKDIPYEERKQWKTFWLVDPLDGTKEFITGNSDYTVNIALMENNNPVAGVIFHPEKKMLYAGIVNKGYYTFDISADKKIDFNDKNKYKPSEKLNNTLRIVASRSHINTETTDFIEKKKLNSDVTIKNAGSSLKFCMIASGEADIYPRFGPTMEWDTAAGHAILKSAGKNIFSFPEEAEMQYNKPSLLNGWFVAK